MKYPDDAIWWLTVGVVANAAAVLLVVGLSIWTTLDNDRKFKFMDERMWNVENAQ